VRFSIKAALSLKLPPPNVTKGHSSRHIQQSIHLFFKRVLFSIQYKAKAPTLETLGQNTLRLVGVFAVINLG
jgi:hypothetical protein